MLPQQARKARDEARLKASQLEGFRARMGQRFSSRKTGWIACSASGRGWKPCYPGTESEPGEIARLVAGYEVIKDAAPASRAEAEPEPPAPPAESAPSLF